MKPLLLGVTAALALTTSPALTQGVPTFDGQQMRQLVLQIEHMARDLNVQLEQLVTMKEELETQVKQLFNLEAQLTSLIESSGVGKLYATVKDFQRLKGKLTTPIETARALAEGDFLSGFNPGAELKRQVKAALEGSGMDANTLKTLSDSDEPADRRIATAAGASAMLSVAAQEAHTEAGASLDRLQTMVGLIDDQEGLKAAVDLNTRVSAELGIILTQIWRLEAAQGVSAGQLGVVDAATLAAERKFRSMEVPE
ncbi:type IV secretion system protein [Sedimentitalea sp. JM2-8]|uniref:Type IV secretion system protein n=1 Tax=Sedimentitalea xiamensis TaxID=3050037 RepID=A0ABT7FJW3_9RHOB|nr:type IV secretion system protein [Sedimentitalea xiamensis]MDK3075415.1 type IV secretion system protein [Sedimentitalea xiamensis]